MRGRTPVCASWPGLTKTPCAVTLSMSLGDFIEVLEQNRQALLPGRLGPRDLNGTHARTAEPADRETKGSAPSPLKSWLRRKDHEAFLIFQRYFDEAVTYATLAALKTIMEGVASDPKHAFESLARRYPGHWSKVVS